MPKLPEDFHDGLTIDRVEQTITNGKHTYRITFLNGMVWDDVPRDGAIPQREDRAIRTMATEDRVWCAVLGIGGDLICNFTIPNTDAVGEDIE